ncbi:unnamed protein product [Ceratitis capitata]|uniref:(Mediterranean fruit fly) hypothetical protein n=1 Tax=Ceratitis capitata TaxID=7213 RepID=A0A811ULI0_CERCA|nr:unnamed protein product [Ceratitis capitata]
MFNDKKKKKLSYMQWALIALLLVYWLLFFPLIWFVIKPPIFMNGNSTVTMNVMFFVGTYIALNCIIYLGFTIYQDRRQARLKKQFFKHVRSMTVGTDIASRLTYEEQVAITSAIPPKRFDYGKCAYSKKPKDSGIEKPILIRDNDQDIG